MEKEKSKHTLLKTVCCTAAAGTAAYGGYAYLLFRNGFDTDKSRYHPNGAVMNSEENALATEFVKNSERHEEYLSSYDGIRLHATRIENHPSENKWMILMHGYHRCSWDLLPLMIEADKNGFNLLAVDERGSGHSEGHYTGLGWPEHYDLLSWINYLCVLRPECKIALYGIDLGASAVMNATGDFLASNVKCAIVEDGWLDIRSQFVHAASLEAKLPVEPFMPVVNLLVRQFLNYSLNDISTARQLSRCRIPMLFMHGEENAVIPVANAHEASACVHSEKEVVIFKSTGLGGCRYQETYYEAIFNFLNKYL